MSSFVAARAASKWIFLAVVLAVVMFGAGWIAAQSNLPPDVEPGHPHAAGISWVLSEGMMSGKTDGLFDPDGTLTRGQIATILHNYHRWSTEQSTEQDPDARTTGESAPTVDG